jgi:hypothetical protein
LGIALSGEVTKMLSTCGRAGVILLLVLLIGSCPGAAGSAPYPAENDLIEVMFARESVVRLSDRGLVDLATDALAGVDEALAPLAWHEWRRISPVPEERLDELHARGSIFRAGARTW